MGTSEHPSLATEDLVVRGVDLKFLLKPKIDPNYICRRQNYMLEHELSLHKNNSKEYSEIQPGSFWQASLNDHKKNSPRNFTEKCFCLNYTSQEATNPMLLPSLTSPNVVIFGVRSVVSSARFFGRVDNRDSTVLQRLICNTHKSENYMYKPEE